MEVGRKESEIKNQKDMYKKRREKNKKRNRRIKY